MILPVPEMYGDWKEWARAITVYLSAQTDLAVDVAGLKDVAAFVPNDTSLFQGSIASGAVTTMASYPVNVKDVERRDFYEAIVYGQVSNSNGAPRDFTITLDVVNGATDLGTATALMVVPGTTTGSPFIAKMNLRSWGQPGRLEFRGIGAGEISAPGGGPPTVNLITTQPPFNFATVDSELRLRGAFSDTGCTADVWFALVRKSRARA